MHTTIFQDPTIRAFIEANKAADIKALALSKSVPQPRAFILDQIKARQKAALKLPHWAAHDNIIYPPADIIEQASSFATATYKTSLVSGHNFADLTAGSGADSFALAQNFRQGHCIERDETLAEILSHNAAILSSTPLEIHCASAEEFIRAMPEIDCAYIDPQRRNTSQRGLYKLTDCSPNIIELLPHLKDKAKTILIKASPMLDLDQATRDLKYVTDIHIVEHKGDCKELLFILKPQETPPEKPQRHAVNIDTQGNPIYRLSQDHAAKAATYTNPQTYLYEPSPALQKAAIMDTLTTQYPVQQLAPNTNLFTAATLIANFPGRSFKIITQYTPHKKSIPLNQANLTTRNYPETVDALKKKLALKDGGNAYLFACTLKDGTKTIIHCEKSVDIKETHL